MLFIVILTSTGYYDYKTKTIPNFVHVLIIIAALIPEFSLIDSLLGLFLLPLPFIITIFINFNGIGGGDIKLVGAMGFFLGLEHGLVVVILALTLVILKTFVMDKGKNKKVALGPYFAIGSTIILFL